MLEQPSQNPLQCTLSFHTNPEKSCRVPPHCFGGEAEILSKGWSHPLLILAQVLACFFWVWSTSKKRRGVGGKEKAMA